MADQIEDLLSHCCPCFMHSSIAQHLDDCAESFLMSIMHNGFIRTMKANYKINAGDVSVIRPLVYCRESLITEFVSSLVSLVCHGIQPSDG